MRMTIDELYRKGVRLLELAGIEDAVFDARCLIEHTFDIDTTHFMLSKNDEADSEKINDFLALIERRASYEPLQYILGKWEFMNGEFYVGEGVLIPRPETELLVEFAVDFLKSVENPIVFDLCSGSGCIAISVADAVKNATVYAVEKYDGAFEYLKKNIAHNNSLNVKPVQGDIFDSSLLRDIKPDLVLSNPPYIRSEDLPSLQTEVRCEPSTALDGGEDGYDFYRLLCSKWLCRLSQGGAIAVECAEDQTEDISDMLSPFCRQVNTVYDLNSLPRVVTAVK